MAFTLLASACPAVQVSSAVYTRASAYNAIGTAPSARSLSLPDSNGVLKFNEDAMVSDLVAIHGGGIVRAACKGLTMSVTSSQLTVAAGVARIDGFIELAVAVSAIGLTPGMNYAWLSQNTGTGAGTVIVRTNTTAPNSTCVYLGSINLVSGVGTVDYSGVCYTTGGGDPYRSTNDTSTPSDTPPTNICLRTRTQGGLYLWDGFAPSGGQWIGPMGSVSGGTF